MTGGHGDPGQFLRIFINYRREDAPAHAGRLYDRLVERFGPSSVFMDVDAIGPGKVFAEVIDAELATCDVLLAVIGSTWLTCADERGERRLSDPHDFVRIELEAALRRNITVVPVLVEKAQVPSLLDLPPSLAELSRRQALEISDRRWGSDLEPLIDELAELLKRKRLAPTGPNGRAEPAGTPESVQDPAGTPEVEATGPLLGPKGRVSSTGPTAGVIAMEPGAPTAHAGVTGRGGRLNRQRAGLGVVCALVVLVLAAAVAFGSGSSREEVLAPPQPGRPSINGKIAFIRRTGPEDPAPKIFMMNPDGSEQKQVAETTQGDELTWSGDGTTLAYQDLGGIYTIRADGTGERRVPTGDGGDDWPTLSPDGTKLAFRSLRKSGEGIYRVNVDGSDEKRLTSGVAYHPAWSPDGTKIAFTGQDGIYVMNADGTAKTRMQTEVFSDAPTWSPDSRQLAFRQNSTISVIDVAGGGPRALASPGGTAAVNPVGGGSNKRAEGGGDPSSPSWSPDGSRIAYDVYRSGTSCIVMAMDADGSNRDPLTDGVLCDHGPAWQPVPKA